MKKAELIWKRMLASRMHELTTIFALLDFVMKREVGRNIKAEEETKKFYSIPTKKLTA